MDESKDHKNKKFWDRYKEVKNSERAKEIIPKIAKEGYSLIEINLDDVTDEDSYVGKTTSEYTVFPNALWHISSNRVFDEPIKHAWNLVNTENGVVLLGDMLEKSNKVENSKVFVLHFKRSRNSRNFKLQILSEKEAYSFKT